MPGTHTRMPIERDLLGLRSLLGGGASGHILSRLSCSVSSTTMPPRKSLPAPHAEVYRSLTRRGQSSTPQKAVKNGTASRKRQRLAEVEDDLESIEAEFKAPITRQADGVKPNLTTATGGMDPEKELEHWQDFAVEHYEMVEQLPLELHRNYRLLRELDDGVAVHAEKLQNTIREYIAHRLGHSVKSTEIEAPSQSRIPPLPSLTLDGGAGPVDMNGNELASVMDIGVPESDGQGGEVMPAPEPEAAVLAIEMSAEEKIAEPEQTTLADEGRPSSPTRSPTRPETNVPPEDTNDSTQEVAEKKEPAKDNTGWKLLPEIARLAREMVKNGEEKVAVAQGAYNSIDRHIRALDSALSAQEASILLGLRPSTLPSTAVENGLENGDTGALADVEEGTIGTGGGGARRKGRGARGRGRGRGGATGGGRTGEVTATPAQAFIVPPEFADADPNEPRYCYCNQVSYGEMMACDNDDCPIEWFHIACAGFTAAPTGNWLCNICNTSPAKGGKATGTPAGRGTKKGARGRARGRQTR